MELISHLSSGTIKILRLPSSFSISSVSLDIDTSYDTTLFFSLYRVAAFTRLAWIIGVRTIRKSVSRVETLGSPVFPCYPLLSLICSSTPVESPQLVFYAGLILPQLPQRLRLQHYLFRGSIAYLQQSLSTLRANISIDYARLASGG